VARITEAEAKRQLEEGGLSSLYVVAGEEKHMVRKAAQKLITQAAGEAFPEFNRNELDSGCDIDALCDACVALPFMAEHKCVAVRDFDLFGRDQRDLDKLYELMEALPETTTLVLWFPTLSPGGRQAPRWNSFLKKAEKCGSVLLLGRRSPEELRGELTRQAKKAGCTLPPKSLRLLLDYGGQDMNRLLGEMEKLCAYTLGMGETEITPAAIERLVPKSTEITVFLMVDALVEGNYQRAYSLLENLFAQKEKPTMILGAMASAYVDMYRVQGALDSGLQADAPLAYGDYKGKDFRLRRAQKNLRRISGPTLCQCLSLLLEADLSLKSSRLQDRLVLDGLIARLLLCCTQGADR
jgi:DNA polymerase-3 subunit delta